MAQLVKHLPAMPENWLRSLGWEDPLEKGKATHPIFWPEEFYGLYSPWGRKELDTTEQLSLSFVSFLCKWYICYLSFSYWLISLSMIISGSIHVVANGVNLIFFVAEWYSTVYVCMYVYIYIYIYIHRIFIHSSLNVHLDYLHVLCYYK